MVLRSAQGSGNVPLGQQHWLFWSSLGPRPPHSSSVPRSLPLPHQHCSIARCVVKIEEENHMQVSEELHVAKEAAGWNAAL